MNNLESRLVNEFSDMFPGYSITPTDDEGFKLVRYNAIETEDGKEGVWIATVYDMAELFMFLEFNRKIVNSRSLDGDE
jgi:hypothetical protein